MDEKQQSVKEEIKFGQLSTIDEVFNYIKDKSFNHKNYCYYSSLYGIDKILDSRFFWMTPLQNCNDLEEPSHNGNKDKKIFCLCFSATFSENLPMWYLYGGINGKGARLTFPQKAFKKFINDDEQSNLKVYQLEYNNENDVIKKELIENSKYKIECCDIVYYDQDEKKIRFKHNLNANNNIKENDEVILEKFHGFIKALPWYYEKEFRISISFKDDSIFEGKDFFGENEPDGKSQHRIAIEIPDEIYRNIGIMTAPEFSGEIDFNNYAGITKLLAEKIEKSKYHGKIKMRLKERMCENCNENMLCKDCIKKLNT